MARSELQKLKLLYLKDLLEQQTDEQHPLTVQKILDYLQNLGIQAERKAIYNDIACLQAFGMDILHLRGKNGGYYLASREFELPELKLLVDAVQSSKFLTTKKSLELIAKLSRMTSRHLAVSLTQPVMVTGRVKTMVESIYYLVDQLQEAISQNSRITFRYFEWGLDGQRHFREGRYEASPYALVWDNENYYLVAHSPRHGITHYRVDKMADICATGKPRIITDEAEKLSPAAYGRNVFSMFGGTTVPVRMRFHRRLAGVVLDRFGMDTMLIPDGPEHFIFSMDIAVSPPFFAWLAGFGDQARILSPEWVIDQYILLCQPAIDQYRHGKSDPSDV